MKLYLLQSNLEYFIDFDLLIRVIPSRFRLWRGEAIISGSACGSSGPIDRRAVCGVLFAFS